MPLYWSDFQLKYRLKSYKLQKVDSDQSSGTYGYYFIYFVLNKAKNLNSD